MAADAPRLAGVRYAVLALGDRAYANFCETGRQFDERLAELGATQVADRIECDLDYDARHAGWLDRSLAQLERRRASREPGAVIHVDFARAPSTPAPSPGRALSRRRSPSASGSAAAARPRIPGIWNCLSRAGSSTSRAYSLGFRPNNDPALVDAVLVAVGLCGDAELRAKLSTQFDITTLTRRGAGLFPH